MSLAAYAVVALHMVIANTVAAHEVETPAPVIVEVEASTDSSYLAFAGKAPTHSVGAS